VEPKPEQDQSVTREHAEIAGISGEDTEEDAESFGALPRNATASDPVEDALARALSEASAAGRFDVVAQVAKELEARRLAQEPNVVSLAGRRRGAS
jgi:hypothetical protein